MSAIVTLPGWGQTGEKHLPQAERSRFLERFIEQKHMERPVIVAPSMSGSYAIHYMMRHPRPEDCTQRMRGFLPIAPVHYDQYEAHQYHRCEVLVFPCYIRTFRAVFILFVLYSYFPCRVVRFLLESVWRVLRALRLCVLRCSCSTFMTLSISLFLCMHRLAKV